jgi:enoyl-CoA hydratase
MDVRYEADGPVALITIDRPQTRNAIDGELAGLLAEAFEQFDADPELSVAVLFGDGGHFCAGADITKLDNPLDPEGIGPLGPTRMLLHKPVIAAIEGYAVAGGLELALWCDLRVASKEATFGVYSRRWGVPLIDGGTVRLPRMIGTGRALDMILTGRPVGAEEALQWGLVNRLAEPGEALDGAVEIAWQLALPPQRCLRNDRLAVLSGEGLTIEQAMAQEFSIGLDSLEDAIEGTKPFLEGEGRHGEPVT